MSKASKKLAEKKRAKLGETGKPDIVQILLNPEREQNKEEKLQRIKQKREEKE